VTEEEKQRIRALFVDVLTVMRGESEANIRTSAEVVSLLGTVRALDPTFDDNMEAWRKRIDEDVEPLLCLGRAQFDESIRKVESGEWI
jgi:hypothetical protein